MSCNGSPGVGPGWWSGAVGLLMAGCVSGVAQPVVRRADPTFRLDEWTDQQIAEQLAGELEHDAAPVQGLRQRRDTVDQGRRSADSDTLLVIVRGRGELEVGCDRIAVAPGSVVRVPAGVSYRALGPAERGSLQALVVTGAQAIDEHRDRPERARRSPEKLDEAQRRDASCQPAPSPTSARTG